MTVLASHLMKEFEGLIHYAARRYGAIDHPILNPADLVQEGWMIFSKLWGIYSLDGETLHTPKEQFTKIFKTSLFNHMKKMLEAQRYTKKRIVEEVELTEELLSQPFDEVAYRHYIYQVRQILSDNPEALKLFENLIDPEEEVIDIALSEAKRKKILKDKGLRERGCGVITVKVKHIRKFLKIPKNKFDLLMEEVKNTVTLVISDKIVATSV